MAKNIEPKLKKIGDYLKLEDDTTFIIPEYQRPYSWRVDHCDKLWQDIVDFVDRKEKQDYFFGTIIINCQDSDERLVLIDGQQRTTTFLLLLKALLICINIAIGHTENDDESESLNRGLKERRRRIMGILYRAESEDIPDKPNPESDREIYKKIDILKNESINEIDLNKPELANILKAVDYSEAKNNVRKIPKKRKDNIYTNFFRNFKYFYEKISELSATDLNRYTKGFTDNCEVIEIKSWDVDQAITMFNSLNSDGLPLYDSDIISARMYASAIDQGSEDAFNKSWKKLLEQIGELNAAGIVDIDSILMQQMYYERAARKEIVSDKGAVNVTTPGLRRYFINDNMHFINNPIESCSGLRNLANIWKVVSDYPIVQVLLKFNENSKLFLASYFYRFDAEDISEDKLETILKCLLRLFAVLEVVDTGYSSSDFKSFLFKEEVKLVDSTVSEQEIEADFDKHIKEKWDRNEIKNDIIECSKNSLVYLNEYLYAKEKNKELNLNMNHDIEHIMPSSGRNNSIIRADACIGDDEDFASIANRLGNKILLEVKINRAIGNDWFRMKISTKLKDKTGYIDSIFPIACELVDKYKNTDKPYWKKEDINNATEEAADRIVKFIFGEEL